MKDYLLIEKSKFSVKPSTTSDYTYEGIFTEFDSENRNGRVYTKSEFMPHFKALKSVVESGTCVGELDHPKQFETTLKNVSHKIEDIWIDESNNCVMGRIKLLDTDAGKQAKALADAGIPLHISSRAAGTVMENKNVKIHKLFTYDLVDTPGFANARMNSVNESFGFLNESSEESSDFAIYEVESQIKKDMDELNNKNKEIERMEYLKESDFNEYSGFTKEAIESIKQEVADISKIQESIIEQNDSIVDEYSNADFKSRLNAIDEKLNGVEKWADHVKTEFDKLSEQKSDGVELSSKDETIEYHVGDTYDGKTIRAVEKTDNGTTEIYLEDEDMPVILEAEQSLEVGKDYKGMGVIRSLEVMDDGTTKIFLDSEDEPIVVQAPGEVENLIDNKTLQEKYDELQEKFDAMIKWTEHVTESVTALEKWSDHSTDTVTAIEKFADHVTESVTNMENWSDHVTESVTALENEALNESTSVDNTEKINENKVDDFKTSIYNKLETILEAKEQGASDQNSLNESKVETLNENESPLWMQMIPSKYKETWNTLEESEKVRITKRANLFEFKTESMIKDFWNNEFTKENLIKEEKTEINNNETTAVINERRMNAVKSFNRLFG